MHKDLGRLRASLDRCHGGPISNPNWDWTRAPFPSITTVTATVVSRPTGAAAAAAAASAAAGAAAGEPNSEWGGSGSTPLNDDDAAASAAAASAASGSSSSGDDDPSSHGSTTPTFVTMIDVTAPPPASAQRGGERARTPSGDTSAHGERNALLPIERFPLLWPIRFELPFTREQALQAVEHSLGVAWHILRRLYHFPLDPP